MATAKKTNAAKEVAKEVAKTPVKETKAAAPAKETKTAPKATKAAAPAKETAKKACAKKAVETKVSMNVQFGGKNYSEEEIIEAIKTAYAAEGNTDAIKTLEVYVQPETGFAYYVVNGIGGDRKIAL